MYVSGSSGHSTVAAISGDYLFITLGICNLSRLQSKHPRGGVRYMKASEYM